ncbi:MAG TPA: 50S ribosomal protein L11 methyltransferase [Clostridiaceae bacterium]|nr:50S ribosomal protein L11 methyltransferase [Clostridiaceae bacterium]
MTEKQWLIFQFKTTHEAAFALGNYLLACGAAGISSIDKIELQESFQFNFSPDVIAEDFINGLDSEVVVEAYFPAYTELLNRENELSSTSEDNFKVSINQELNYSATEVKNIAKQLIPVAQFETEIEQSLTRIAEFSDIGQGYIGYRPIKMENWSVKWKEYYDTRKIGRIIINPSWLEYTTQADEIVLNLEPGSAFGTGEHESTSLVLNILSEFDFNNLPRGPILDLGTGSGILAIALAKLLPEIEIIALDIDPHAIEIAKNNAELNFVENIEFSVGELNNRNQKFSLIVANLTASIHLELIQEYKKKLSSGGYLILSGIIDQRADEVRGNFEQNDFISISEINENDWVSIVYRLQMGAASFSPDDNTVSYHQKNQQDGYKD